MSSPCPPRLRLPRRLPAIPPEALVSRVLLLPVTPHSQSVGDPIDVVKPRSDQSNLQDSAIIESDFTQFLVVFRAALRRILRQFYDILQHRPVLVADRRRPIIPS